jgi:hypothetical protein
LKFLDSSLSQAMPIAESSFITPGSNGKKTVKSYARGTAQ